MTVLLLNGIVADTPVSLTDKIRVSVPDLSLASRSTYGPLSYDPIVSGQGGTRIPQRGDRAIVGVDSETGVQWVVRWHRDDDTPPPYSESGGGGGSDVDVGADAAASTLAPGSPATAVVTEPATNFFHFAFGIPRGADGAAGAPGAQGPPGPKGDTGATGAISDPAYQKRQNGGTASQSGPSNGVVWSYNTPNAPYLDLIGGNTYRIDVAAMMISNVDDYVLLGLYDETGGGAVGNSGGSASLIKSGASTNYGWNMGTHIMTVGGTVGATRRYRILVVPNGGSTQTIIAASAVPTAYMSAYLVGPGLQGPKGDPGTVSGLPPRVTSLPGSPVDGQECYFVADVVNGILWHLKYNAGSASPYKWEYVGGPEFLATNATVTISIGSGAYLPQITVPLSGLYDLAIGARLYSNGAGGGDIVYSIDQTRASTHIAYFAAIDVWQASVPGVSTYSHTGQYRNDDRGVLNSGDVLKAWYLATVYSATAQNPWMRLRPVRVG